MRRLSVRTAHRVAATVVIVLSVSVGLAVDAASNAGASGLPAGELIAQAAPPAATPGQTAHPHRMHRHGRQASSDPMKYVEARISELHKRLHITPDQDQQFKAYADVMRSNAQAMQDLFQQRAQDGGVNALDRLRWYAKLTAVHADAVSKLVPPFEALYQSMSDKQKKAADIAFEQIRQRRPAHQAKR